MNYFKILQAIKPLIQSGKLTRIDEALSYLQSMGMKIDGILRQGVENMFKKIKARDPEFNNVVKELPIDDQGIPFNPKTLKSTKEKRNIESLGKDATPFSKSIQEFFDARPKKESIRGTSEADKDIAFIQEGIDDLNKAEREADLISEGLVKGKNKEGVETLFEEVKVSPKEVKYGKPNYELIAEREGIDVELIKGKSVKEIIEYLAMIQKADGGRVGFEVGGLSDEAQGIYDAWMNAGHTEADTLSYLTSQGLYNVGGEEAEGIETITATAPTIGGGGGGGDGQTGFGLFGNLDKSTKKTVYRDVWSEELGMAIPQPIDIYQDSGNLWKTYEGKNPTHAGLDKVKPLIGNVLSDFLGIEDEGYQEGDIMGTYSEWNRPWAPNYKDLGFIQKWKVDSQRNKELKDMQNVGLINLAKQKEQEAAAAQAVTSLNELTSQASGGGGRGIASAGVASGRVDPAGMGGGSRQATSAGAQKTDRSDKGWGWREGGLATMFTRRR